MHVLDFLFGALARGPRFFKDGWGDRELVDGTDAAALARRTLPRLSVHLGPARRAHGGLVREGSFRSPDDRLPTCARLARIHLLLPEGPAAGVAIHLAAGGDEGFSMRLRLASPLLARGIGALVLENPYYGARKPRGQRGPAIRSISELHLMGAAVLQEARALLAWLREQGFQRVGVTGFSMGGQMSAMAGASAPFPVAIVPVAPTCTPASVLRDGVLRGIADWAAIGGPGSTRETAREALCRILTRFSVLSLPRPVVPRAAIVVGTRADGVVPPSDMAQIAHHWGCELRWLNAGHVSAVLRHFGAMRRAIGDAFERLELRN